MSRMVVSSIPCLANYRAAAFAIESRVTLSARQLYVLNTCSEHCIEERRRQGGVATLNTQFLLCGLIGMECRRAETAAPPSHRGQITTTKRSSRGSLGVRLSDRMVKVERAEQIVECRAVGRHIQIVLRHLPIGKVVAAAVGQRPKIQLRSMNFGRTKAAVGAPLIVLIPFAANQRLRQHRETVRNIVRIGMLFCDEITLRRDFRVNENFSNGVPANAFRR